MVHFLYRITFQVVPSLVVFIHPRTQDKLFNTSTESRWACSCQNCYLYTDYFFLCLAVFTFFWAQLFACWLIIVSCILTSHRYAKFLSRFLHGEFQVVSSMCIISSFSWIGSRLPFLLVVVVVAMLIMCSVINHGAWLKLYTHTIWSEHKIHINFAHRTLNVIEIKAKKLHCHYMLFKLMLIHAVDFTCSITLHHTL
jgi:hypothetical protein